MSNIQRRDFNKLVLSAVGGIMAGAVMGCPEKKIATPPAVTPPTGGVPSPASGKTAHACKGHNACKSLGACKTGDAGCAGKNSCKGKGGCATPTAHHACTGKKVAEKRETLNASPRTAAKARVAVKSLTVDPTTYLVFNDKKKARMPCAFELFFVVSNLSKIQSRFRLYLEDSKFSQDRLDFRPSCGSRRYQRKPVVFF